MCASEILEYSKKLEEFEKRDTELVFISEATEGEHVVFFENNKSPQVLGYNDLPNLPEISPYYLQDPHWYMLEMLGGMDTQLEPCQPQRLTLFLDENLVIRYAEIASYYVGRNPSEHVRILDALQTGELCGACRKEGEATLKEYQGEF